MTLQMGVLVLALLGLSSALVCPDGGMCEDKNTCCKNTVGGYGCCPLPHAECCSDHLHCCYQGTVCDLVHSKCVNKTVSLPWMRRVPTKQAPLAPQLGETVAAVICPDGISECPDETTCCQLRDGSWGCCPLEKAVCCEDKLHCCPEGTTCDLLHSKCVSSSLQTFPMLQKLPARRSDGGSALPVGTVACPGGKSSCPDSYTCCLLTSGEYGCCPYPQAMCCSDRLHCCPSDTVCDLEHGVCKSGAASVPMLQKVAAMQNDVVCPDRKSACPDETTCCKMADGSYGCCPMPNAVCCQDHVHCCPAGTECDLIHSTCTSAAVATEIHAAAMTTLTAARSKAVRCNDSVACADGNTCCRSAQGRWACCPLPQAVCCDDQLHCCPHGTTCNLAASTCDDPAGGAVTPWLSQTHAVQSRSDNSKCDRSTSCPGKSTCCRTESGWACCPLVQAVCCDDHVHCCPHGTVCNLEAETCDDPSGSSPPRRWEQKLPALSADVQDEKCDKETMCPGGTTCCRRDGGQWACCPLPQAVCCSDREHCCPKGYRCNVAEQTCDKPGAPRLPWLHKIPPLQQDAGVGVGVVPAAALTPTRNMCDAQTSCPRDTTCCFMDAAQKWGCCPLPHAVCCKDGNHCCPSGHTCEPHRSSCSRGRRVLPWFTKLSATAAAEPGAAATVSDIKCDNTSSCAAGTTCCKLPSGEWGCCPLLKAVCCADHEHCCPQGYACRMQTGTCEKKSGGDELAVPQSAEAAGDVPCDATGEFSCPPQETCCRVSATAWACCPAPRAVCCSDSKHCCPPGFSCDLQAGGCSQTRLTWDMKRHFVPRGL